MLWRKLSEKVKLIWLMNEWLPAILLVLIYYLVIAPISMHFFRVEMNIFTTIITGGFLVYLIIKFLYVELKYRHFRYLLGENEIAIEEGILNKKFHTIPYEKVQNISIVYEILHRLLKVGKIIITTAAGDPQLGEYVLDGIDNPNEIAEIIARRVEKAKGIKTKQELEEEKTKLEEEYSSLIDKVHQNITTVTEKLTEIEWKVNNIPVKQILSSIEQLEIKIANLERELEKIKIEIEEKKKEKKTRRKRK